MLLQLYTLLFSIKHAYCNRKYLDKVLNRYLSVGCPSFGNRKYVLRPLSQVVIGIRMLHAPSVQAIFSSVSQLFLNH